jgi:hypothetical protein
MDTLDNDILRYLRSLSTFDHPPTLVGVVAMFDREHRADRVQEAIKCMINSGLIVSRKESLGGYVVEVIEAAPVPVAVAEGETP